MSVDALLSSADGRDTKVELQAWRTVHVASDQLLWIDLEAPEEAELDEVADALKLSDRASASLHAEAERPGAIVHDDAVEIALLSLDDDVEAKPVLLEILIGEGWVVTRHATRISFLATYRERIQDQREIGRLQSVDLLVAILDAWVDTFFGAAEGFERDVDELDDAALRTDRDLLTRLVRMRRRIARARRLVSAHREVVAEIARPDFIPVRFSAGAEAIRGIVGRLDRATDAFTSARDMLIGTFDVHMTRTAQRTNDVMRVLTIASVILLPAVVIAGVMGMNFKAPIFDNPNLFYVVVGVMVALAVGTLLFARSRHWL
jgi:magnesium/cobalt transport protein CorA